MVRTSQRRNRQLQASKTLIIRLQNLRVKLGLRDSVCEVSRFQKFDRDPTTRRKRIAHFSLTLFRFVGLNVVALDEPEAPSNQSDVDHRKEQKYPESFHLHRFGMLRD